MSENNQRRQVTDLSARAISIARAIDRLPPGVYTIELSKFELKAREWEARINRIEQVQTMRVPKKNC